MSAFLLDGMVVGVVQSSAVLIKAFLEVFNVARKSERDVLRPGHGQAEPPCIAAGDDRNGPESPSWVLPRPSGGDGGWRAALDPDFAERFPTLSDFLTLTGYGGKARRSGTFQVFCEDGKWKGRLQDRDGGYVAFLSSESFTGLLEVMERGLKGGCDWREDKYARKK